MTFSWKKTAIILIDLVIAVYLLFAITVLNNPEEKASVCSEVNIHVGDEEASGFMTPEEVKRLLMKEHAYPLAEPMQFVSTRHMEEMLLKNPFIESAECYKTLNGHVRVNLKQRRPVIHVMTAQGEQYYIDDHGNILPHTRQGRNLLVATGNISRSYAQKRLATVARQIMDDPFWENQTVQLNVLADGSLELVPRIGDHIIFLGAPTGIPKKLQRLRKFYKYGLSQAGWDRYDRISVEFDNQIICKKRS